MSKDNFSFIDEADKWLDAAYARGQLSGVDGKKPMINDLKQELRKAVLEGFKAAMLEHLPPNWTDEPPETIPEWLKKHPQLSPNLPENARLQVAYSRAFGYNQALDDVRQALETLVNSKGTE